MELKHCGSRIAILCGLFLASLCVGSSPAATITLGSNADTYLRDATARGGSTFMDVRGAAIDFRGYLRFDLSSLAGNTITNASLLLTATGTGASRNDAITSARFALYGLNNDAGNSPQNWDEATFVIAGKGTENVDTLAGVTDLDDNVAGISEVVNPVGGSTTGTVTISGAPLASFLQGRLGDGGLSTFILSNDDATDRGYGLGTKENATDTLRPALTIEYSAVPEPTSIGLVLAAGVIAALNRRPKSCSEKRRH